MARIIYAKLTNLSLLFVVLVFVYHIGTKHRYWSIYYENRKCAQSQETKAYMKQRNTSRAASDGWEAVRKRFALRRENLINVCKARYLETESEDVATTYVRNIFLKESLFVSDKYKILYCEIPKCSSTNMARFLAGIEGLLKADEDVLALSEGTARALAAKHLWLRNSDSLDEAVKKIEGYTKVVVVRDPFSRLVSAFRDKLENNPRNDSFAQFASWLHAKYGNGSGEQVGGAPVINFDDFLIYLKEMAGLPVDRHWNVYHRICDPCTLRYQYIVNMDTIDEDIEYIKSQFGIHVPFPPSYNTFTDKVKVHKYFVRANPLLVNQIYHIYKLDYELFGFTPPPQF